MKRSVSAIAATTRPEHEHEHEHEERCVHVHRRVAIHGFALNVGGALDGFDLIVPCRLATSRTTSIAAEIGAGRSVPALHVLASRVANALGRELGVPFIPQVDSPSRISNIEMSEGITRMIYA